MKRIYQEFHLDCDLNVAEDCVRTLFDVSDKVLDSEKTRDQEAKKRGFVVLDGMDCCPKCLEVLKEGLKES